MIYINMRNRIDQIAWPFIACIVLVFLLCPGSALAETPQVQVVLCKIVHLLIGPIGYAIATVAVVVLGIGLFMGKISWMVALSTCLGLGILFGSPYIVNWISPEIPMCP